MLEAVTTASATLPPQQLRMVLFRQQASGATLSMAELEALPAVGDEELLWIDISGPTRDLPIAIQNLGIAVAHLEGGDAGVIVNGGGWSYLHARALNSASEKHFSDEALVVAVGPNIVLTAHERPIDFLASVLDDEAGQLRVGRLRSGSFAASLLDRMLTDYLDARDEFESAVDRIELLVLRRPHSRHLAELQLLRRQASKLRRYLAVQRDLFDAVARPDFDPDQPGEVAQHWQLLSARYSKSMMAVESARELVNGSFDVYTSRVAHGTNETMRLLTVVTVILGTLAVAVGVLGMNFDAKLFESGNTGFWWAVSGMAAFAVISIAISIRMLSRH